MKTVYVDNSSALDRSKNGGIVLNPDTTYIITSPITLKWLQKRKLKRFSKKQYQTVINWRQL